MTMFAPLRQSDFAEISGFSRVTSSEALPAKTSAAPTPKAKASRVSAPASTSKPSASSEKSALVGSLLRTALISELGALTPSSLRWRPSATPAGRLWSVLETSAPITNAGGPGSSDAILSKLPLSTPRASDMKAGGHGDTGRMGSARHQLQEAMLATPRKTGADRGFRGDVLSQLQGYPSKHAGMLPTPTATRYGSQSYPEDPSKKRPSLETLIKGKMPTPLASDRKGSLGVMSGGRIKSPNVPTYLRDGKWDYARQIAAMLTEAGLTGPSQTLPITYGWMMGYPPGWLARALESAVRKGLLPQVSSLKRSATPSSRKSRKLSDEQ